MMNGLEKNLSLSYVTVAQEKKENYSMMVEVYHCAIPVKIVMMKGYRPEILEYYTQEDVDEPIEEQD